MQHLLSKISYPLVVISFVVTVSLQLVWLNQLFTEQKRRLIDDVENLLSKAGQQNVNKSMAPDSTRHNNFEQFLGSTEWDLIRHGFDNIRADSSYKGIEIIQNQDSAAIIMQLVFLKKPSPTKFPFYTNKGTPAEITHRDSLSLLDMKQRVNGGLDKLGVFSQHYVILHEYSPVRDAKARAIEARTKADFISQTYSYSVDLLYKYQLVIPSLRAVVWYKMRYHVISSILTLFLTAVAFYFIYKLVRNTRLYADARLSFTSNMTHEIKTPIAAIALAIEGMRKYGSSEPDKMSMYLDIGSGELDRLNRLTEKILNLSNSPEDYNSKRELFDLQPVIQDVLNSMDILFKKKNSTYNFVASQEPCFVEGNQLHLSNVFYNLFDNALKYHPAELSLSVHCYLKTDQVVIEVNDNGPSIAQQYHKKIFERFFRIPQPGSRHNVNGSGLGLYYVKQVVTAHGGKVMIQSEKGNGNTFVVMLKALKMGWGA